MDKDFELREEITEMLLALAAEQQELTTSDFQSRAEVVARRIIALVRGERVTGTD
jgi:hypothetical protein